MKPTSNNQLNKNKKNGNLSSFRIKLKDLFAPDLPLRSVKTVAGYTSQLTSPPAPLLLPFSPFHVPQVLFARILYVLNNNSPHGKLHLATCFPWNIFHMMSNWSWNHDGGCPVGPKIVEDRDIRPQLKSWKIHPGFSLLPVLQSSSRKLITRTWPEANWKSSMRNDSVLRFRVEQGNKKLFIW